MNKTSTFRFRLHSIIMVNSVLNSKNIDKQWYDQLKSAKAK